MKEKLILTILALLMCASSYSYNWDEIADSIASQQKGITSVNFHSKIERYRRARKSMQIKTHYDSTFVAGDTVIIMEYHNPYKDATHSALWIKGNYNSFMTYDTCFNIDHDYALCFFSIYMRKLCERWDLAQIRREESEHPQEKPHYVIATRLILKPNNKYVIESVFFELFRFYPRDKF